MKPSKNFGVYQPMPIPACGRFPVLLMSGLLLILGGCASDEHAPQRRDAAGPRRPAPAPIAGHADYFDGKIGVDLRVGALELPGATDGTEPGQPGGGRHRRGGMSMGGGGGGGPSVGPPPGLPGGGGPPGGVRPMMGSMGPAEMIHLQFTNHGSERVTLDIVDFVSPLGNFAVQPARLVLEPGQSLEVEPMSSRIGGSVAEVKATLVLRLAGRTEKKIVVLRAVLDGSPAAAITPVK